MRHVRRKDPSCVWYGLIPAPEDAYGVWTCCSCGRVIRRDETYSWRGQELRCEKCMEEENNGSKEAC